MKIAIYHPDKNFSDVDCTHLEDGNPGIGGSEYAAICLAEKLALITDKFEVLLITQSNNLLIPSSKGKLKRSVAETPSELLTVIEKEHIDYIIVRYGVISIDSNFYSDIKNCKIVIWCQNFVPWRDLNFFEKNSNVVRLICVGKEQMELYVDHPAYEKSDYIFNFLPQQLIEQSRSRIVPFETRGNDVVYMGSLVRAKSFDTLAKAWPKVIKQVPNAKLHVIGSGQLYNRNQKLGKYGIAEESYEQSFIPYIIDDKGKIIDSVHFYGNLGAEKMDVMSKARVAVPNPTGKTETFCICGIEMQLCGCLITTARYTAYLDTINDNYSILYDDTDKLADSIIKLLSTQHTYGDILKQIDWIEANFSLDKIVKDWENLFINSIPNNTHLHPEIFKNLNYKKKRAKLFMHKLKMKYPVLRKIPSLIILNRILKTNTD